MKFRTKITLLFITLLFLNSSVAGALYYNYAYKDTLNNFSQSSEDIVYQMNVHIHSRIRAITSRVYALNNNMSFTSPLSDYFASPKTEIYVAMLSSVANSISELQGSDDYIDSVFIYSRQASFDNYVKVRKHDIRFEDTVLYQYYEDNSDAVIGWFPAMESPIFKGSEIIIPVVYKYKLGKENIYTIVSINQANIANYLEKTYQSYDKIFIVDKNGNNIVNLGEEESSIFAALDFDSLKDNKAICQSIRYRNKEYLATYSVMKGNGWKICALKSTDSLLGNLSKLRFFIMLVLGVSFLLCMVTVLILVSMMTKPLGQLVNIMNKAIKKEFHVQFNYPYDDEVGNLAKSFNYMVREMDEMVTELNVNIDALEQEKENVKAEQTQKRKAELRALQAQINPHFLYNTLNAITWQAEDQGATDISILANSLGKFFRISLSKGRQIITIQEELDHVRSYLEIQKIRYKTKLNYEVFVPEDIRKMSTIKLILQPLVENAIYHGIKMKETPGTIKITAYKQEQELSLPAIKICVEDDGLGISKEKLDVLNEGLSQVIVDSTSGYGIYNVNERLKLYYGDAYGLTLESKEKEWTKVTIVIPEQMPGGDS
jgi:two-component system sensor histidine kinase YesM